jgi:hypothetical protein
MGLMPQWLELIALGAVIYAISLAPIVSVAWKPFLQWVGGVLALFGLVLLILLVLGVHLPGTQWLGLIALGVLVYGVSLAPPIPLAWKPFLQWIGGLLAFVGFIWLLLLVLGVPVPGVSA